MLDDREIPRKRNWVATICTLIVLILVGLFFSRVLYFTKQIQSGAIDPSTYSFRETFSSSLRLAAIPLSSDDLVEVTSIDDPSLGRADASMTIVEFADFGCPYSKEASFALRELALKYPEKFRYIYRDFPIPDLHPIAQKAAEASGCAGDQGQFWQYHDKLYQNQSELSQERFIQFARELNLNSGAFRQCLDSGKYRDEVKKDYEDGLAAGVRGTPTFFLNGVKVEGSIPKETLEEWIVSAQK